MGAGGSGQPPPTKPTNFNKPTPAPPLDIDLDEKKKKKYPTLELTPLKPCRGPEDAHLEPQISRIFPMGGPDNVIVDPSLPLHPSNNYISRDRCTRAAIRETHRDITDVETRIADLEREIRTFNQLYDEENALYNDVVDTFPKTSTANIKKRVDGFYRYQQRSADLMINIVRSRFNQRRLMERLEQLHRMLEAQRVGWGYAQMHPRHEFVVVFLDSTPLNPIVQRTQPLNPNARRRLNLDDLDDEDNNIPKSKRPRDKRETNNTKCTVVPLFNVSYLTQLIQDEQAPGIYLFQDKQYEISQKLDHLNDVFQMLRKTLHAWHDSWFYTTLHKKMNQAFSEFYNIISNEEFSTYKKKRLAIQTILDYIVGFMDEHYQWYANPEKVPEKIITKLHETQNKL